MGPLCPRCCWAERLALPRPKGSPKRREGPSALCWPFRCSFAALCCWPPARRPADAFTKRPSADQPDADPLVCASLRAVFRHGRVPRGIRASLAAARRAGRLCGAFAFLQLDGWAFSAAGRWRPLPRSERTAQPFSLFARADALFAASGIGNACTCAERRLFRASASAACSVR